MEENKGEVVLNKEIELEKEIEFDGVQADDFNSEELNALKEDCRRKEEELNALKEELKHKEEALSASAEDFKRKWYAVSAEYDNYRKRNAQAVSKAYEDGVSEAVLKLLTVADNFGYAYDGASDEKTRAGIEKVIKGFKTILSSLGVEEIEINPGDQFDENIASAVLNFPCEKGEKPNSIKQVLKKGYRKGEKVIRFAQVAVTI